MERLHFGSLAERGRIWRFQNKMIHSSSESCRKAVLIGWSDSEFPGMTVECKIVNALFLYTGFRQCNVTDQIKMVQDSLYPLSLLYHCMSYNMDTGDFNWFVNTPKERDLILTIISPFASMGNHFRSLGYALKKMGVTDVDLSFLATMAVITASGNRPRHFFIISCWKTGCQPNLTSFSTVVL